MALPITGDFNWGAPLNDYIINVVQALAQQDATDLSSHKTGTDPHGDRAYSQNILNSLTGTVGNPNGLAQLGPDGRLKASQVPAGGGRSASYDVVRDYGATGNGTTDDSAAIQAAITACAAAGGGEIWFPTGTFAVGNTINIPSGNVWLHLSDGAIIKRIAPFTAPSNLFTNWLPTSSFTSYSGPGNIRISGGTIDSNGVNVVQPCTAISIVHASNILINDVKFINNMSGSSLLLAGCSNVYVSECQFNGYIAGSASVNTPAIAIEFANGAAIPGTGSYDNTPCDNVNIYRNVVGNYQSLSTFGSLISTAVSVTNLVHTQITVNDNNINNVNAYGVNAFGWDQVNISDNQMFSCNGAVNWQVPSSHSTSNLMTSCIIRGNIINNPGTPNQGSGVINSAINLAGVYTGGATPFSVLPTGAVVQSNSITGVKNPHAIYSLNVDSLVVISNNIMNGIGTNTNGVSVFQCLNAIVSSNKVSNVSGNGIYVGPFDISNIKTSSNSASISSNSIVAAAINGVNINFSTRVSVCNNTISSTPGVASTAAILFQGTSDYGICSGNAVDKYITATSAVNHGLHNDMTRFSTANVANITGTST